ncbi:LEC14B protein isoform X2, partial [Tanacetum coccineum]
MSPIVHIVNIESAMTESVANVTEMHEGLDFLGYENGDDDGHFGIFSVKFSTDGHNIVAASSDESIYVYDLAANKINVCILAHSADVFLLMKLVTFYILGVMITFVSYGIGF